MEKLNYQNTFKTNRFEIKPSKELNRLEEILKKKKKELELNQPVIDNCQKKIRQLESQLLDESELKINLDIELVTIENFQSAMQNNRQITKEIESLKTKLNELSLKNQSILKLNQLISKEQSKVARQNYNELAEQFSKKVTKVNKQLETFVSGLVETINDLNSFNHLGRANKDYFVNKDSNFDVITGAPLVTVNYDTFKICETTNYLIDYIDKFLVYSNKRIDIE